MKTPALATLFLLASSVSVCAEEPSTVDPENLEALRLAAERAGSNALVIVQNDELVAEWYFGHDKQMIELMSVLKSVVSLGIGHLILEGEIESLDQPVHEFFPEWKQGRKKQITVRHLLNHTSCLQNVSNAGEEIYPAPDAVRLALAAELVCEPGSAFSYNNKAVNLLAGVIHVASGQRMDRFFVERFFRPLGITQYRWHFDASGTPHAMAGLALRATDLAKFGLLVLAKGEWRGQLLVDPEYIHAMLSQGQPHTQGVGLLWWIFKDGGEPVAYFGQGYLGQYLVVVPESKIVGVRQVLQSEDYDPDTDLFREFVEVLLTLASRP